MALDQAVDTPLKQEKRRIAARVQDMLVLRLKKHEIEIDRAKLVARVVVDALQHCDTIEETATVLPQLSNEYQELQDVLLKENDVCRSEIEQRVTSSVQELIARGQFDDATAFAQNALTRLAQRPVDCHQASRDIEHEFHVLTHDEVALAAEAAMQEELSSIHAVSTSQEPVEIPTTAEPLTPPTVDTTIAPASISPIVTEPASTSAVPVPVEPTPSLVATDDDTHPTDNDAPSALIDSTTPTPTNADASLVPVSKLTVDGLPHVGEHIASPTNQTMPRPETEEEHRYHTSQTETIPGSDEHLVPMKAPAIPKDLALLKATETTKDFSDRALSLVSGEGAAKLKSLASGALKTAQSIGTTLKQRGADFIKDQKASLEEKQAESEEAKKLAAKKKEEF